MAHADRATGGLEISGLSMMMTRTVESIAAATKGLASRSGVGGHVAEQFYRGRAEVREFSLTLPAPSSSPCPPSARSPRPNVRAFASSQPPATPATRVTTRHPPPPRPARRPPSATTRPQTSSLYRAPDPCNRSRAISPACVQTLTTPDGNTCRSSPARPPRSTPRKTHGRAD